MEVEPNELTNKFMAQTENMAEAGGTEGPSINTGNSEGKPVGPAKESPISGLTRAEFDILSSRYTTQQLHDIAARLSPEEFRVGAGAQIQQIRAQEAKKAGHTQIPGVSPEAQALRQLGAVAPEITSQVPRGEVQISETARVAQSIENRLRVDSTLSEADLEVPEGLRDPEMENSPEMGRWLVERIVFMETKLKYGEGPGERYSPENGPKLNEYYARLRKFVEREQADRHKEAPMDDKALAKEHDIKHEDGKFFLDEVIEAYKKWEEDVEAHGIAPADEEEHKKEDLSGLPALKELIDRYNQIVLVDLNSDEEDVVESAFAELPGVREGLLAYFKEAKNNGLLVGVDAILNSIYDAYREGEMSDLQVVEQADKYTIPIDPDKKPLAYLTAERQYQLKLSQDRTIRILNKVWEPYLRFARGRLDQIITDQAWYPDAGEWRPGGGKHESERNKPFWKPIEGERKEIFWKQYGGYPDYYTIEANTPAEFRTAMETFLQMVRNKALGYAPDDLMQNLQNFQKVLSARATRLAELQEKREPGPDKITTEFATEIRQEFQGRAYLWYTFYQYEHYNKENGKNGNTALAMHEGPQRWTKIYTSGEDADVAFHTRTYDYDEAIRLALHAEGSRGQLGSYTVAQEYLRNTIFEMQREKGMGIFLKNYDRRDVPTTVSAEARLRRERRLEGIKKFLEMNGNKLSKLNEKDRTFYTNATRYTTLNRRRTAIHQSDEEFMSLFEIDAHRKNFADYQEYILNRGLDINRLPERLQKSARLGMVQAMMDQVRQEVRDASIFSVADRRPIRLKKGESLLDKALDRLIEMEMIKPKERSAYEELYKDAYTKSLAAFETTQQIEGVTHEATIRGKAVYFIQRNPNNYSQAYWEFRQQNQKQRKAKDKDISQWTPAKRKAKFKTNEVYLGWILDEISKGARIDSFTAEEQAMIGRLTPAERKCFTDYLPADQAWDYGMAAVNWVRIYYGDNSEFWQDPRMKAIVEAKDPETNHYKYPNFRAIFRAEMSKQILNRTVNDVVKNGFQATLKYAELDIDEFVRRLSPDTFDPRQGTVKFVFKKNAAGGIDYKDMTVSRAHIFGYTQLGQPIIAFDAEGQPVLGYDQDHNPIRLVLADYDRDGKPIIFDPKDRSKRVALVRDPRSGKYKVDTRGYTLQERQDSEGLVVNTDVPAVRVAVDKVVLDFNTAVHSDLALHTTHTYWAYQSNNTHTLIPEHIFKQAEQIRDGLLRPQDADILAGMLLTLDPTLARLKSFPGDQMSLEALVFDAAVEESLMNWVSVQDAFNAKSLPRDGNTEFMRLGYFTEDLGGDIGFTVNAAFTAAKQPKRWARRFAAAIGAASAHVDTMGKNIGRRGASGAVSAMADNINELTGQPIVSQFSLLKYINLLDSSTALWFAMVGGKDPKDPNIHHEGLFTKPTNNADKLSQLLRDVPDLELIPGSQNKGFYALLDSFGRCWDVLRVIRTMYSDNRNAGGALLLTKKDIFLPNGRFNPEITLENFRDTGSSRHIARRFWDTYVDWLLDEGPGGGAAAYPDVAQVYKILKQPVIQTIEVKAGDMYIDEHGQFQQAEADKAVKARDCKVEKKWVEKGETFTDRHGNQVTAGERYETIVKGPEKTWSDWMFDKMGL